MGEKELLENTGILGHGYGLAPMLVLADKRLSDPAKLVYMVLMNFARGKGSAFPSQKTIASILNKKNVATVSNRIQELEDTGYIKKTREGQHGRLVYTILNELDGEVQKDLFGSAIKLVKPKRKGKKVEDPKERELKDATKRVLEHYFKKFEDANRGEKCSFPFGPGNNIVKDCVKQRGEGRAIELIDAFFRHPVAKKKGYSIYTFKYLLNELVVNTPKGGPGAGGLGFKKFSRNS
jgi:hypothetical protein